MSLISALVLLTSSASVSAQANNSSPAPDPAITPLSVMGIVSDVKPDVRQVLVTTAAGNQVTVSLSDRTEFMRIPPGEKTKDKFVKITSADFTVGDSIFARGRMSADQRNLPALEFYVMSKGDIVQKREHEQEEWRTRGIAGTISAVNPETKEISLDLRTSEGPKPIIIATTAKTQFRRYAPDSIRFGDARPSSMSELKVGDQLRALGKKTPDGSRFTPEEIVSGSFQTIGGAITEVNAGAREIKLNETQSHQTITIVITKDSSMRRLTPELLAALSPAQSPASQSSAPTGTNAKSNAGPPNGSRDLQRMFDQLPAATLQELKPGDSILVSSTKTVEASRVTAIAIVSGVAPLLQNSQGQRGAVALGAMSLGGP
jgi:hypothetical protein